MRESRAEGSEGRAKLRDERHSHVIRERQRDQERSRETETASCGGASLGHTQEKKSNTHLQLDTSMNTSAVDITTEKTLKTH